MLKALLVIPQTYISRASIKDPTEVLKGVQKSSKISKKVDNTISPINIIIRLGLIKGKSIGSKTQPYPQLTESRLGMLEVLLIPSFRNIPDQEIRCRDC